MQPRRLSSSGSVAPRRQTRGKPARTSASGQRIPDHPAVVPAAAIAAGRSSLMPSPPAQESSPSVDCTLIDPESVPDGIELGSWSTAVSSTHDDREVRFSFRFWGGTLVLDISCEEISDPCAARPIKVLSEVICCHRQLVLLRVCSTDFDSPTNFFVYSFPYLRKDVSVHKITKSVPKNNSAVSQSFGLLRHQSDCDKYVVASLEMLNPKKHGYVEVLLHRWQSSSKSWSSSSLKKVTLASTIDMREWQTDQVVPYLNDLLWADLRKGILFGFKNPLQKDKEFRIIYLPHKKSVRRPEIFMSVGCCNSELKFVNLNISGVSEVVTIMTFNERELCWRKTSQISLRCTELRVNSLPVDWSEYYMPCFPVLHTEKDNILYLTMAKRVNNKRACLLQVDTKGRTDSKCAILQQDDTESDTGTEQDTESSTDSDTSTESSMEGLEWALLITQDFSAITNYHTPPTASD